MTTNHLIARESIGRGTIVEIAPPLNPEDPDEPIAIQRCRGGPPLGQLLKDAARGSVATVAVSGSFLVDVKR